METLKWETEPEANAAVPRFASCKNLPHSQVLDFYICGFWLVFSFCTELSSYSHKLWIFVFLHFYFEFCSSKSLIFQFLGRCICMYFYLSSILNIYLYICVCIWFFGFVFVPLCLYLYLYSVLARACRTAVSGYPWQVGGESTDSYKLTRVQGTGFLMLKSTSKVKCNFFSWPGSRRPLAGWA